jgi:hypothetical protein
MPAGHVGMGAPVGFSDNTDSATTAYLSLVPDPLELELCVGEGPPTWVDPMLEELVASLALKAGALAVECSPPSSAASHGVDAFLGDIYSLVKGAHWTMDSSPLSPVQEGQPGAAVAMTCPTHPDTATVETIEDATDVANRTPSPQMPSTDEPVRDTICGSELALPTSSSCHNVMVVQGTHEVLPLQLFPDASSPVKKWSLILYMMFVRRLPHPCWSPHRHDDAHDSNHKTSPSAAVRGWQRSHVIVLQNRRFRRKM